MKNCLIWGTGKIFFENINIIKYHQVMEHFNVIGVTSNTKIYSEIMGYDYIDKKDIAKVLFDVVIIMAKGSVFKEIYQEAINTGIPKEKIFKYTILHHPNFDMERLLRLKENPPSIFANNCWGGLTYHSLDLEFNSPFINMYESTEDYLKFLTDPKRYIAEDLKFIEMGYNETLKIYFPIAKCGDILLNFNHYESFETANECWERRKKRIDWDNLFVMMQTQTREFAEEFLKLPYEKKVCFVPFESEEDALIYVEIWNKEESTNLSFGNMVNAMAKGAYPYYNVFDLIEKAKVTPIVQLK